MSTTFGSAHTLALSTQSLNRMSKGANYGSCNWSIQAVAQEESIARQTLHSYSSDVGIVTIDDAHAVPVSISDLDISDALSDVESSSGSSSTSPVIPSAPTAHSRKRSSIYYKKSEPVEPESLPIPSYGSVDSGVNIGTSARIIKDKWYKRLSAPAALETFSRQTKPQLKPLLLPMHASQPQETQPPAADAITSRIWRYVVSLFTLSFFTSSKSNAFQNAQLAPRPGLKPLMLASRLDDIQEAETLSSGRFAGLLRSILGSRPATNDASQEV